jgi:hypothetical protein
MESKGLQKRLALGSQKLHSAIVNRATGSIYSRFAQLAEEAAEGVGDDDFLNAVSDQMRDVKEWTPESFKKEAAHADKKMPQLRGWLDDLVAVDRMRLYGSSDTDGEEALDYLIKFIETVYISCSAHFAKFPLLVCSNPQLDPDGGLYKSGEREVKRCVVKALTELVPPPGRSHYRPAPAPAPVPAPAQQEAAPPAAQEPVAPRGGRYQQQPLSKTVRAIPLRDRPRRASGDGNPSEWRDE